MTDIVAKIVASGAFTLAGVILGMAGPIFTEKMRNEATHRREREARTDARRDLLFQRRNELQRATLLELQDQILKSVRNAVAFHYFDQKNIREHGTRDVGAYPEQLQIEGQEANGRTAILGSRVRDKEVRELLRKLKADITAGGLDPDADRRAFRMEEAKAGAFKLNERIGEVLRTLDDQLGTEIIPENV